MNLCNKNNCTGCTSCVNVCPKKAISMIEDDRGFLRPYIDEEKCIKCGMCERFCITLNKDNYLNFNINQKKAYAVKLSNDKKRLDSQSGGLFTALAESIIEKNGVVYGAALNNDLTVSHCRIDNINELEILKKSKYVQSDLNTCFSNVIEDLKSNKYVLFSGTPCQVYSLLRLIEFKKVNSDLLYTCDFICHGVPSPKVLKDYLIFMKQKNNKSIKSFNFRNKYKIGWHNYIETITFEDNTEESYRIYGDLFYSNLTLRESCEKCKYCSKVRYSDITMGDCWGIEEINPDLWNDNKGISICLINTSKGNDLFFTSKNKLDIYELDYESYSQKNTENPSSTPKLKNKFWKDYNNFKFEKILKKYTIYGGNLFKLKRKFLKLFNWWAK